MAATFDAKDPHFQQIEAMLASEAGSAISVRAVSDSMSFAGADRTLFLYIKRTDNELTIVFIRAPRPGTGLAARILDTLKEYALQEGIDSIDVELVPTEGMRRFCVKHGFHESQPRHYVLALSRLSAV